MMDGYFTHYVEVSGEILGSYGTDNPVTAGIPEPYIAGLYLWDSYYINNGEPILRPVMPVSADKTTFNSDNTEIATISGIPEGAAIYINNEYFDDADATGELEIASDVPKIFNIRCKLFPYLDGEINVQAV